MARFSTFPALHTQTFDLGKVQRNALAVQGRRLQNRLAEARLGEYENTLGRRNRLQGLIPGIAAGDEDAIVQGARLDPEETRRIVDLFAGMDERQQAKTKDIPLPGMGA